MEVVTTESEGLDFPTANVLKITADNHGSGNVAAAQPQFRTPDGYIPIPAVGESLYYRYYIRIGVPDAYDALSGADHQTHGTQDGNRDPERNWKHQITTQANGTFILRLAVTNSLNNNPYPSYNWSATLNKHQTYRIETQIHRVGTSEFTIHGRVYDAANNLVLDDNDFVNSQGTATLADDPTHNLGSGGAAQLGAFRTGLNSLVETETAAHDNANFPWTFAHIAGVAICRNTWCGPYQDGI
jgi:hypothetical protein